MKFIRQKYFLLIPGFCLVSFFSCKKEKMEGVNNCCCPIQNVNTDSVSLRLENIYANGYFVMQKFYTINNNLTVLDSTVSLGFETMRGDPQITYVGHPIASTSAMYSLVDSVKVNNIRFQDIIQWTLGIYKDSTHTDFQFPRHFQFYGDTAYFDIIDYLDNTGIPSYTGYNLLPDSVTYNKDFYVNIGNRTNTKECYLQIKTAKYAPTPIFSGYISNNVNSFTISTNNLPYDWNTDKVEIILTLRNWSSLKIKNRDYYFISEHIYHKY